MTKPTVESAGGPFRHGHPYFMYDAMRDQPRAIAEVLERNRSAIRALAHMLERAESLTLAGAGASLNAAMLGEYWLRTLARFGAVRAENAFELARYRPPIESNQALLMISHSGSKRLGGELVTRARAAGALTASICGVGAPEGARAAEHVLLTVAQERSGAHTVSLTTALALLLELAIGSGEARGADRAALAVARRELSEIQRRFEARLGNDAQERAAAERYRDRRRVVFLGAGPNYVSAREGALKMKEATFISAEALELEEFLHGPIAAVDPETLVVMLSARGAASERMADAARAIGEIGAARLGFVGQDEPELAGLVDYVVSVESAHEPTSPFAMVLSLQLFTYYSALTRGCDPDRNHCEDPRYARAAERYR